MTFRFDLGKQICVSVENVPMFPNHILDINGFEAIDVNMRIEMLHELSVVIFYVIIFYK